LPRALCAAVVAVLLTAPSIGCKRDEGGYFGTTKRIGGRPPGDLYVATLGEPEYLDPGLVSDQGSSVVVDDLFEGLLVVHPQDLHLTQGVATHYDKSDDNRFFRFYLRPEARWSDGKPVTAHDFVYAWRRVLTPAVGSRMATMLHVLKNGRLFQEDKLKVLSRPEVLRATRDASDGDKLEAGTPLTIVAHEKDAALAEVEVQARPRYRPEEPVKAPARRGFVPIAALHTDASVVGVRAKGDHVLEVELERPTSYFLELCAYHTLYPVRQDVIEHFEAMGRPDLWYRAGNIVVNGPYTVEDWVFRYAITLTRNPHHYDYERLKTQRVVWQLIESYIATLNLYKTGDLDYIGAATSLPNWYIERLSRHRDYSNALYAAVYYYELNVEKKPLDDVRVRQALNLAVDKQLLVDSVTRGGQAPATHYVPDVIGAGYSDAVDADRRAGRDPFAGVGHDFDPDRARALLRDAGYKVEQRDGEWHASGVPSLEILYNTSEGHRAIAVALQDMWKRHLGLTVQLRNEEFKVMLKNMRDGNFQIARLGWIADYNHPHSFMDTYLSYSDNNWTRWHDKTFDGLVEEAARTADPLQSIELYRKAEAYAVAAMPRLPLYFYTKPTLIKPFVKGYWDNVGNRHLMRWLWIDPAWREGQASDNVPSYPPRELPEPGKYRAE
jgi:oligopeptide transport system substrate-binding protein